MKQYKKLPLNSIYSDLKITDLNQKGQGMSSEAIRKVFTP